MDKEMTTKDFEEMADKVAVAYVVRAAEIDDADFKGYVINLGLINLNGETNNDTILMLSKPNARKLARDIRRTVRKAEKLPTE